MSAPLKVSLQTYDGRSLKAAPPAPDSDHAVIEGQACPSCKALPWRVQGHGRRPSEDDRALEADASCKACGVPAGVLRVEVNTLFGVREDRAVLEGRCRVY